MPIYYPIDYFTYNRQKYYQCIGLSILFFAFFIIVINVFQYELFNQKNVCDPKYYYGTACRNEIANTIYAKSGFMPINNQFYAAVETQFDPSLNAQKSKIDGAGEVVDDTLNGNIQFAENTVNEVEEAADVLQLMTTKYLGNLQQFMKTAKSTSSSTWDQIQQIPGLLNQLQGQINQAVVTPALARYVSPLQKLYKSLADVQLP